VSEKATVLVSEVKKVSEGEGDWGTWSLYHMTDGDENKWPTFSKPLAKEAQALEGKWVEIEWEQNDKGKKFTSIKETTKPENGTGNYKEKLGTGDYVRAKTSPSDARGVNARKAGDLAEKLVGTFAPLLPTQEWNPGLICAFYDSIEFHIFSQLLRRERLMDGEDIPFDEDGGNA
jgi:hypothetical protein